MRIGVAGCGHWGRNHVRIFKELGVLWAVADPSAEGRDRACVTAPDVRLFDDFTEFLLERLDGVVLATPAETHAALATQALQSGMDVLVEKPLALTFEEARRLCDEAERLGRMLMVGHVLEYHPAFVALLSQVQAGRLGQVHYIYSNRLSLGQVRRSENVLWSFAPHDVEMLLAVTGQRPTRVLAQGNQILQPDIEDVVQLRLDFPGHLRGHVFLSWLNPVKEQRLVVVGDRALAVFDQVSGQSTVQNCSFSPQTGLLKGAVQTLESPHTEPLKLECQAFLESIQSRRPSRTNARLGLPVVRVLQAAQESLGLEDWVSLSY